MDGFETGADDYLAKPFAMPELLARQAGSEAQGGTKCRKCCLTAEVPLDGGEAQLRTGRHEEPEVPLEGKYRLTVVGALLRRGAKKSPATLRAGDLTLELDSMVLTGPKGSCTLTRRETDLLALLLERPGQVVPRERFFQAVWGVDAPVGDASLDTYIYFLRRRLKTVGTRWKLTTRRGTGYLLQAGSAAEVPLEGREAQLRKCRLTAEEIP